ncbi:MAG: hypothetical protein MJZ16_11015 [Bacteroidales bacterium]|nr:hypothetical protein [Bacteroidales bacterium]
MKKIFSILAVAMISALSFTSCETYSVEEPEMTAVSDLDGEWICFATNQDDPSDKTLLCVQITNTTNNEADKIWMTITDLNDATFPYLDAIRFKASCSGLGFSADAAKVEVPRTCRNPYYEQSYYSYQYRAGATTANATVNGSVTKNVDSPSGYKYDTISFTYTRIELDGTVIKYNVKGSKNTGWAEDMKEYADFAEEQGWW